MCPGEPQNCPSFPEHHSLSQWNLHTHYLSWTPSHRSFPSQYHKRLTIRNTWHKERCYSLYTAGLERAEAMQEQQTVWRGWIIGWRSCHFLHFSISPGERIAQHNFLPNQERNQVPKSLKEKPGLQIKWNEASKLSCQNNLPRILAVNLSSTSLLESTWGYKDNIFLTRLFVLSFNQFTVIHTIFCSLCYL